jgi:hypothetical protein
MLVGQRGVPYPQRSTTRPNYAMTRWAHCKISDWGGVVAVDKNSNVGFWGGLSAVHGQIPQGSSSWFQIDRW